MVGPVTEEFAFRACMLPLLLLQVLHPSCQDEDLTDTFSICLP